MSIQIKLHVEDLVINLLDYQQSVTQNSDYTGRPSAKPVVQPIGFSYETVKNDPFFEKLVSGKMSDTLTFKISPIAMNGKSTTVTVKDYYIKVHHENFDGINNQPMTTYVEITFAILIVNDVVMDVKYWKVSDPYQKSPVTTLNYNEEKQEEIIEEKKDKKCVIKFEADNNDIKNGIFGFDTIPDKYKRICTSDITKLENEYPSLTIEGEKYFPAWVSMRKDQTITLDLKSTIKQKEQYESIAFEEHLGLYHNTNRQKRQQSCFKRSQKSKNNL
ncbi:MAG: hypothetical protein L3J23_01790 [Flavobacteriaceae bacterium]|nr:hypothetical protein [Flavobacteriaceae bacterium]